MRKNMTEIERMKRKLRTVRGEAAYKARGKTIEPLFGQIKHCFQGLTWRGLAAVNADWAMLCLALNMKGPREQRPQRSEGHPARESPDGIP